MKKTYFAPKAEEMQMMGEAILVSSTLNVNLKSTEEVSDEALVAAPENFREFDWE